MITDTKQSHTVYYRKKNEAIRSESEEVSHTK